MSQFYLTRTLKLKTLEFFKLSKAPYAPILHYMLLLDLKRPSTLEDYPYLKGVEDESEFGRSNFIKVLFISPIPCDNTAQDMLLTTAGGFLENMDDCDWNADFETIDTNTFSKIAESRQFMCEYIEKTIKKYGQDIPLTHIKDEKFNYLSQD